MAWIATENWCVNLIENNEYISEILIHIQIETQNRYQFGINISTWLTTSNV